MFIFYIECVQYDKESIIIEDEIDKREVECEGGATSSEKRSTALKYPTSIARKNRTKKTKTAIRKFHAEWENLYFLSEYQSKAICFICRLDFTEFKKFSFEQKFSFYHKSQCN